MIFSIRNEGIDRFIYNYILLYSMKNIMVSMDEELLDALKDTGNSSHTIREAVKEFLKKDKTENDIDLRKKDRQDNIRQTYRFVDLGVMKAELKHMQHPLTIECMMEYILEREKNDDYLCERKHDL